MYCQNCGKDFPENSSNCPYCGSPAGSNAPNPNMAQQPMPYANQPNPNMAQQPMPYGNQPNPVMPPKKKKPWKIILIAAAVIIVLIIIVSSVGGDDSSKKENTSGANKQNTASTTVAESTTLKAEYNVGDTLKDGSLSMTYVTAETWDGYDSYCAPAEGNKVVRLKFDLANTGTGDCYVSSLDFSCYADNTPASAYYYGDDELSSVTLSAGRTASGHVYFEIPENAQTIEVEYEVDYWSSEKVVFKVNL